jgi:hypothetical protein
MMTAEINVTVSTANTGKNNRTCGQPGINSKSRGTIWRGKKVIF